MFSTVASNRSMVMVSETQSGNLDDSPLQSLQFPTMTVTQNIARKKLKIKITSKKIEAGPEKESHEFGQQLFVNDDYRTISVNGKKSQMNKSHKFVLQSYDDQKTYANDNLKVRLPMRGSNKHGPPAMVDLQKEKRQKMDRTVKQQCGNILRTLMTHPTGWVFNKPVDPVALGIPDYFSIISEPMDLGTIKTKLEGYVYFTVEEFAADVRLTFSNAMLYNPPGNSVHLMAKQLDIIFSRRWKMLEAKLNRDIKKVEEGCIASVGEKNTVDSRQACHKNFPLHFSSLPITSMSCKEKEKLRKELVEASRGVTTEKLRSFLQKIGLTCQKEETMEMDMDAFDDDTLWELKRLVKDSLDAKPAKAEPAKMSENGRRPFVGKVILKGTVSGNRSACGSADAKRSLNLVNSKCGSCNSVTCQCSIKHDSASASSSDLSSERSLAQDIGASKVGTEVKNMLTSCARKSDPDSDGAVSAFDKENICSSLLLSTPTSTAAAGEGWTEPIDVQLSPRKALRAAMLKSRFAGTILKAKQKSLLDQGDKIDPVKMQQEKERLERQQQEEKARIEAQIRAAEAASRSRAEAELKMQREREREAARIALQKMEKTVEFDNLEILKEIEILRKCPVSDDEEVGYEVVLDLGEMENGLSGNPLERLGLFIKEDEDYMEEDVEEVILNGDGEEGEIFS